VSRVVIVTGIPGTGKTTVCNLVEKLGKDAGAQIGSMNYGTVMVGILQKQGKAMERDSMRKDSVDSQRELQKAVAKEVSDKTRRSEGITIIDTHMSIKTASGYLPGMPYHVLQLLNPQMFVLVEADPREICSRRLKDATRKRDDAAEEAVREELLFSRLMAGACAVLMGVPVKIVVNAEGRQEGAAKDVLKALGVT